MTPTDESHIARGGILRLVSTCVHCQEVIGLPEQYATGDALVCPVCEKPLAPEEVRPRTLRVALKSVSPPPRPEPETPTPDSLREWLEKSSSQFALSDSVLDPTPSEHARDDASDIESSLSGVDLGSIFTQEKLEGRAEEPAQGSLPESDEHRSEMDSESGPHDEPAPRSRPLTDTLTHLDPVSEADLQREPPAFPEELVKRDETRTVDFSVPDATVAPLESETPQSEPRKDEVAQGFDEEHQSHFSSEEPSEIGEEVAAQLLRAGADRETRKPYLLPVAGVLLALCVPLGAVAYFYYGGDGAATERQPLGATSESNAMLTEHVPSTTLESAQEVSPVEPPTGVETASFEQSAPDSAREQPESVNLLPFEEGYNAVGDRYAATTVADDASNTVEPDLLERVEETHTPAPPALRGAPVYAYQDLFEATSEARPAGRSFTKGSLDTPVGAEAAGRDYAKLCYLAQVLTLLDPNDPHDDLQMAKLEAMDVFKRVLRAETHRELATQIAGSWIEWAGRPHGGVFFVGVPNQARRVGDVYEYDFEVSGVEISVITDEPIDVNRFINAKAQQVGVIGVVVEDPAAHVPGYVGDATQAVWVRKTLALSDGGMF